MAKGVDAPHLSQATRDIIDRFIDHEDRLRRLESGYDGGMIEGAKVRFYHGMILQWLYRGAGRSHPTRNTRAGAEYLYDREVRGVGLSPALRNRIRDLRAQVGVSPHLIRVRQTNGMWGPIGGLNGGLLNSGNQGADLWVDIPGEVPWYMHTPTGWGDASLGIRGPIGPSYSLGVVGRQPGSLALATAPAVVWRTTIPAGSFWGEFGATFENGSPRRHAQNLRVTMRLIPQLPIQPVFNAHNPWGAVDEDDHILDELGEGAWGFRLLYRYDAPAVGNPGVPGTDASWMAAANPTWLEERTNPNLPGGYPPFPGVFGEENPYRVLKQDPDGLTSVYDWISELSPAFQTEVVGDFYPGIIEELVEHYAEVDPGRVLHSLASDGQISARSKFSSDLPIEVVEDLYEEYAPQYGDVIEWCMARFGEWRAGTSRGPWRREQLWSPVDLSFQWNSSNVHYLARNGWMFLRGAAMWRNHNSGTNTLPSEPWSSQQTWTSVAASQGSAQGALRPSSQLFLTGIQYGGANRPAPIMLRVTPSGGSNPSWSLAAAMPDHSDRIGIILDGVCWQHIDPGNE